MGRRQTVAFLLPVLAAGALAQRPSALDRLPKTGPLALHEQSAGLLGTVLAGTLDVAEDPANPAGRHIALNVLVLPARAEHPRPDPIFFLAGGPGQAATSLAPQLATSWMRNERDVVLVDQRGTGDSNPLQVPLPGGPDDLQGYRAAVARGRVPIGARRTAEEGGPHAVHDASRCRTTAPRTASWPMAS